MNYLEQEGEDIQFIYDDVSLPHEFLRDTSYWLPAEQMEQFLLKCELFFENKTEVEPSFSLLKEVGQSCYKSRSWGVLDSVLRMVQNPQDILTQPSRFFSYFISPEPPILVLEREQNRFSCELPISSEQYPHVTKYLAYSFEAIPGYVGKPFAHSTWQGSVFTIQWTNEQENLFQESELQSQLSPQLMQSIVDSLESGQKRLEDKNRQLVEKNAELEQAQKRISELYNLQLDVEKNKAKKQLAHDVLSKLNFPLGKVSQNLMRIQDYMVRASQLVQILSNESKSKNQVTNVLKKVDWDRIYVQFPFLIQDCNQNIRQVRLFLKELKSLVELSQEEKMTQNNEEQAFDVNNSCSTLDV